MATLTVNYYQLTGSGSIATGIVATRVFLLNQGPPLTFTWPDNTGNPGSPAFSAPVPANAGLDFTGWIEFTSTGGNYPITPVMPPDPIVNRQQYWAQGVAGTPNISVDIIASVIENNLTFPATPPPPTTSQIINVMPYYQSPVAICFKEDSEILTYDESADKESYVKVQDLRKGMLVKTLRSGYVPVKIATTSKIYNPGNSHRSESRLYRCPKSAFPELKEDLIITGHHSILVDNLTEEQINEIQETYGRIYITEKKYRLPAFVDERTVPYEEEGTFNIYHFALENSNVKANYGVYANGGSGLESPNAFSGLLVESANEWRLREKSGHKIISE